MLATQLMDLRNDAIVYVKKDIFYDKQQIFHLVL